MEPESLLRVRDVAARLKLTPRTIWRYIASGQLEAQKLPNAQWRIRSASLAALDGVQHEASAPTVTPPPLGTEAPVAWQQAALRLGEELASVGPVGYYEWSADHWLAWAVRAVATLKAQVGDRR